MAESAMLPSYIVDPALAGARAVTLPAGGVKAELHEVDGLDRAHAPANGKDKGSKPKRKKKANRACHHCQKAHLTCEDQRPCTRCIKRNLADTCMDGKRKKAKYLHDFDDESPLDPATFCVI
jgi:hypothetical protein